MNANHTVDTVRHSLATARDSLTELHMDRPLEAVVQRGRVRRRRHRLAGAGGAALVTAAAALAATALMPGGHQPSTQLAAWTVAKQADGNIAVTIRELRDPAGLQSTLRADGVPASVTFLHKQNPSCRAYPASQSLLASVFPDYLPRNEGPGRERDRFPVTDAVVIDPSALPSGTGVQLAAGFGPHPAGSGPVMIKNPVLVYASPHCTGS